MATVILYINRISSPGREKLGFLPLTYVEAGFPPLAFNPSEQDFALPPLIPCGVHSLSPLAKATLLQACQRDQVGGAGQVGGAILGEKEHGARMLANGWQWPLAAIGL